MRKFGFVFLALAVVPVLGWTAPSGTQTGPVDRVPNGDLVNAFPQWTPWLYTGNSDTVMALDSKGNPHFVSTRVSATGRPQLVHMESRYEKSDVRGLTSDDIICETPMAPSLGGPSGMFLSPLVSIDTSNDTIYVVWTQYDPGEQSVPWVDPTMGYTGQYRMWWARSSGSGWTAPVKIDEVFTPPSEDATSIWQYTPQALLLTPGGTPTVIAWVDKINYWSGWNTAYLVSGGLGSVRLIPDSGDGFNGGYNSGGYNGPVAWHCAISPSGQIYLDWKPASDGTPANPGDYRYVTGVNGAWGSRAPLPASVLDPIDVAYDNSGRLHMVSTGTPTSLNYSIDLAAQPAIPVTSTGSGKLAIDSRDQVHLAYTTSTGAGYAARIRNPDPATVSTTWSVEGYLAMPGGNTQGVGRLQADRRGGLHILTQGMYTRTQTRGLGALDSAAMIGVAPGASASVVSGNLNYTLPLFQAAGEGPCQALSLVYNSLDPLIGTIARGWRLNYEITLRDMGWSTTYVSPGGYNYVLTFPDGRRIPYLGRSGGNLYGQLVSESDPTYGVHSVVTPHYNGSDPTLTTYDLLLKNGDKWWFNANGKITQMVAPTGNSIQFTYDSGGRMTEIIDMLGNGGPGRKTTIDYFSQGDPRLPWRMDTITDPMGRKYTLSYSGQALKDVTFASAPVSTKVSFDTFSGTSRDEIAFEGFPKTVTTPRGNKWQLTYNVDGRFCESTDPASVIMPEGGTDQSLPVTASPKVSFNYIENLATNVPREVDVTDRRGFRTKYKVHTALDRVKEIQDPDYLAGKPGITPMIRVFDGYGNVTDLQDRWGLHTLFTWSTAGYFYPNANFVYDLLAWIGKPAPSGTGQEYVTRIFYAQDGFNGPSRVGTYATQPGGSQIERATFYTYNTVGQLTKIDYPAVHSPDAPSTAISAMRTFEYNGPRKQLTRIVNEMGNATDFSNFDSVCGLATTIARAGGSQTSGVTYDRMGNWVQRQLPQGGGGNDGPIFLTRALDSLYRQSLSMDPLGKITRYDYDEDSNLTSVTPPIGGMTTTTYDARGYAKGGSTPDGSWSQVVDAAGNVRRSTDYRNFVSNSSVDFLGRTTRVSTPGSSGGGGGGGPSVHVALTAYDQFDGTNRFITATEVGAPANRVTTTYLDNRGRAKQILASDSQSRQDIFYNEQDQVVASQTVFNGALQTCTLTFRDERDRVDHVKTQDAVYPGGVVTKSSTTYTLYNKCGSVIKTVDPLGTVTAGGNAHKTAYLLDVRERVSAVVDGLGNTVLQNIYGDDDQLIEVRVPDPSTKSTTLVTKVSYTYTARKEIKQALDRDGNTTTVEYGTFPGQVVKTTDPLGRITSTTYDTTTQNPTQVVQAMGSASPTTTNYTWSNGLMTQTKVFNPETGANDATFQNTYDAAGRLEKTEYPTPATGTAMAPEMYYYNDFGELRQKVTGSKTVNLAYDLLGQMTGRTWTGAYSGSETATYNGLGMLDTVSNGAKAVSNTYNLWNGTPLDELFRVGGQAWKMQTKLTDTVGNTTGLVDAEGQTHGWPVDADNRPAEKRLGAQGVSAITYTPGGLIDTETLKNAAGAAIAVTTHYYDRLGHQTHTLTTNAATGEVLSDYAYGYNMAGEVTQHTINHLGASFDITNDERGRLKTQVTAGNNGGANAPPFTNSIGALPTGLESTATSDAQGKPSIRIAVPARTASFTYGASGIRTSQTVDTGAGPLTTTYTYNALNQLTTESTPPQGATPAKTVTHVYDNLGNEITKTTAVTAQPTVTESFGYNHLNLMSTYTNSATGAAWQYDYWPGGERYGKTDLTTNTSELYVPRDGDVVTDYGKVGGAAPTLKNTYVQGLGIDSKLLRIAAGTLARSFMLGDAVGTVGATMDNTGALIETSVKDAWGQQVAGSSVERYGFAQRETDTESGLVYMRHRMYDPRTGRFTQTDPVRGRRSFAHYVYGSNKPFRYTDPNGLWDWKSFWEGTVGVVTEPYDIIQDVTRMAGAKYLGMDLQDVELKSGLCNRQKGRFNEGQGFIEASAKGSGEVVANFFSGGTFGIAQSEVELWNAYQDGKITLEQYDKALSKVAGGASSNAALGMGLSKATGNGWTGRGPNVDPAVTNKMANDVVAGRVEAGKTNEGKATFAKAARVDGEGNVVKTSSVAESNKGSSASEAPTNQHAEPAAIAEVGPGPKVVVVDSNSCGKCVQEGWGSIWGAVKVYYVQGVGKTGSPKSAAMKAAANGIPVEAVPAMDIPFRPPGNPAPYEGDKK